ncbi:MAG: HipA domain-containing protein [Bacteroidia bacterium]|nr:HipA domain-containing protein [Bacteroidia bacterium]
MSKGKTDIYVYADWLGMEGPALAGVLSAHYGKGRKSFSFDYQPDWIRSREQIVLDPDIAWFSGPQFPNNKENFGVFLDSMPDTWGRTLMKRRASLEARAAGKPVPTLHEIDFLLGVFDESRMGALRFKTDPSGPFLDDNAEFPTPPWSSLGDLQKGADLLESDRESEEVRQWLRILMAPGSSLGGARPKANILDKNNELWIAKFPSRNDTIDKAAWEFLAYSLALQAGINMAESRLERVGGKFHTFLTKRFDRSMGERIHFASSMTMTGFNEDILREKTASYLDIAEFIQYSGSSIREDLHQLWRRLIFNIAISNTDDHLRNHGFLILDNGWRLSPAYDLNPSTDKDGLALNIDMDTNSLDFELAKSVGVFFQLDKKEMDGILDEIRGVVSGWETHAKNLGISRQERELMAAAFRFKA